MDGYNSILKDISSTFEQINIPIQTGVFVEEAPDEYLVIIPMGDLFPVYADNLPQFEVQEARISLFTKNNYMARKNQIVNLLIDNSFTITDSRYIEYEKDTGFFHYAIDIEKEYEK